MTCWEPPEIIEATGSTVLGSFWGLNNKKQGPSWSERSELSHSQLANSGWCWPLVLLLFSWCVAFQTWQEKAWSDTVLLKACRALVWAERGCPSLSSTPVLSCWREKVGEEKKRDACQWDPLLTLSDVGNGRNLWVTVHPGLKLISLDRCRGWWIYGVGLFQACSCSLCCLEAAHEHLCWAQCCFMLANNLSSHLEMVITCISKICVAYSAKTRMVGQRDQILFLQ